MNKLVSIIVPYYNASKYIRETIDSIINQTYKTCEILIIDDCSTDKNTTKILEGIASLDKRIKILKTPHNGGAGAARNLGIAAAQGRYLAFCDSDDWWYPTKLEEQLKFMEKNNYPFTCTWYEDANKNLDVYYTMKQKPQQTYREMFWGCNIGTPGVIINIELLGKKYMPTLRRAEDWGLWMLYLKETTYLYTYPKALWKYRHVPGSETSDKWKMIQATVVMYQEVLGMSTFKAWFICFFVFLPKNIWKKLKKKF